MFPKDEPIDSFLRNSEILLDRGSLDFVGHLLVDLCESVVAFDGRAECDGHFAAIRAST